MENVNHQHCPFGLMLGFKIAKLAISCAAVAAAFCISHEIHKVHKAVERREEKK